jgi:hypothetical protein
MENKRLNMTISRPGSAIVLQISLFAFLLILFPILSNGLSAVCKRPESALRISMVLQDIMVFILPAIIMAVVSTRLPAKLLAVDVKPVGTHLILALLTLIVSIPALNSVIAWNESIHLPASMQHIETAMRTLEDNAANVTNSLMAGASVPSLILSILIIGVLAGFSEELFFRGAMQRLVMMSRVNPHVAIWLVAFLFSLLHFQFFGFVPRMLLGAFLGYLLWWTGSFWVPAIVHMFNNAFVVFNTWRVTNNPTAAFNPDKLGAEFDSAGAIALVVLSVFATALLLYKLYSATVARSALSK